MRYLLTIIMLAYVNICQAQTPYIIGALVDAANVGTPSGEGKSEFVAFRTGSSSLALNAFTIGYGTSAAATTFRLDGPTITWQPLSGTFISNSAGTITNITSGSIPAAL